MGRLDKYADHFDGAAKAWNVDPRLLRAVAMAESGGEEGTPDSRAGAAGLMQIMPGTARALGINPYVPQQAIYGAAKILDENLRRYGNVSDALRAYNAGTDRAKWNNPETRDYVGRVASYFPTQIETPLQTQPETSGMGQQNRHRPSDDELMSALTGSSSSASGTFDPGTRSSGGRPDDEAMMRMLTESGTPTPQAATMQEAPSQQNGAAPGVLESLGAGLGRGVKDVRDTIVRGVNWADNKFPALGRLDAAAVGVTPEKRAGSIAAIDREERDYDQRYHDSLVAAAGRLGGNLAATAPFGGPLGDVVAGGVNAGRAAIGIGDSLLAKGAAGAARGAVEGAGMGALTSTGYGEDPLTAAKQGAEFGGTLGVLAPALVAGTKAVGSAAAGGNVSPSVARLANTAMEKYGIPIHVGQMSDNSMVRTADQYTKRIPLSGGNAQAAAQQQAFNRAVGETIGLNGANKITTDDLQAAKRSIGQRMDDIAGRTTIKADQDLLDELADLHAALPDSMTEEEARPVRRQIDNVLNAFDAKAEMNGQLYQNLTKASSPMARALANKNSNISNAVMEVKGALAGAALRSLQASGTPELAQHLRHARLQYKNLKTIEPLVNKSPTGNVSAPALLEAVRAKFGDVGSAGALGELGRIGKQFMKEPPDSGTPTGETILSGIAKAGGIGAGVVTGALHPSEAALAGLAAAGTLGVGRASRAYLGSQTVAKRAVEQALASPQVKNDLLGWTADNAALMAEPFRNALTDPTYLRERGEKSSR